VNWTEAPLVYLHSLTLILLVSRCGACCRVRSKVECLHCTQWWMCGTTTVALSGARRCSSTALELRIAYMEAPDSCNVRSVRLSEMQLTGLSGAGGPK
jgi:hypothetical protein